MRIISLASTIWTERWMNRQQLMSRLGRRNTVLYSNSSWHTWDRHDVRWKQTSWGGDFKFRDNVWVESTPRWMMRNPRFGVFDQAVTRMHAARWRSWLATRGHGPLVLHMFDPAYVDYIDQVRPDAVVYQPYDGFAFMPGWSDRLEAAERHLLARADAVITPSETLSAALENKSKRPVCVVPNGVDIELFENALAARPPAPPDLGSIPHPRLGYCGWLESHVDLSMVAELATRHPDWHFVFVGGRTPHADGRLVRELAQCEGKRNIHFLGPKHRTEVPAYMLNMDVNTICWRLEKGSWADFGYPLKLQEYLACGRSIVSADLHLVRTKLSHLIRTASSVDEWDVAIQEVLRTGGPGSPAERTAVARENSWDRRSEQLQAILDGVLDGTRRQSTPTALSSWDQPRT